MCHHHALCWQGQDPFCQRLPSAISGEAQEQETLTSPCPVTLIFCIHLRHSQTRSRPPANGAPSKRSASPSRATIHEVLTSLLRMSPPLPPLTASWVARQLPGAGQGGRGALRWPPLAAAPGGTKMAAPPHGACAAPPGGRRGLPSPAVPATLRHHSGTVLLLPSVSSDSCSRRGGTETASSVQADTLPAVGAQDRQTPWLRPKQITAQVQLSDLGASCCRDWPGGVRPLFGTGPARTPSQSSPC